MKLLSPLGWLYGLGVEVRNAFYDHGLFRAYDLGAKTISIGNITAGGTGKTPLVALVAEILAKKGEKVCILTRGYGRTDVHSRVVVCDWENVLADAAGGGDEPVELARKLLGKSVIVADPDRVSAARWAIERFGITAFVLDDGFQHRRAKRDIDIVCIDATDPFGGGAVLPAGTLREPLKGLERANAIVITRSNLAASTDAFIERLRQWNRESPIFRASSTVSGVSKLEDFLGGIETPGEDREFTTNGYLFCGLGNPESFRAQLIKENFPVSGFRKFADHHIYSQSDLRVLESAAEKAGAGCLITTGKDAVKLAGLDVHLPCFVISSKLELNDRSAFEKLITSL